MSKEPSSTEMFLFLIVAFFAIVAFGWLIVKNGKMNDLKTTVKQDRRTELQDSLRNKIRILGYVVTILVGSIIAMLFVFALDKPPAHKSNQGEKEIQYKQPAEEDEILE